MDTTRTNSSRNYLTEQWNLVRPTNIAPFRIALFTVALFILGSRATFAQGVGISESSFVPNASAILELRSTSRGLLLPRNTAITTTAAGLTFYNTSSNRISFYDGSSWLQIPAMSDNLSAFSSTTSAQLAGVLSDETGTGAAVFATSPSLVTPTLGDASATSINKVAVTAPATSATLALADGSTLVTAGANSITLTSTGATNVTLPTSGTLAIVREMFQLTADVATTSTTLGNVAGLSNYLLEANSIYYFKFRCLVTTNAATVGILLSLNASAPVTSINYIHMYPTSATAITYQQVTSLQGGTLPTNGPGAALREYTLEGTVATSSAVTLALQSRSETGASVSVKAGSFGWVKKIQ